MQHAIYHILSHLLRLSCVSPETQTCTQKVGGTQPEQKNQWTNFRFELCFAGDADVHPKCGGLSPKNPLWCDKSSFRKSGSGRPLYFPFGNQNFIAPSRPTTPQKKNVPEMCFPFSKIRSEILENGSCKAVRLENLVGSDNVTNSNSAKIEVCKFSKSESQKKIKIETPKIATCDLSHPIASMERLT